MNKKKWMSVAIKEAFMGMRGNEGGPFGAVIVREGIIVAKAHNMVLETNDPTAHAEISAIRNATQKLGRFELSDCQIYSTCEPCPMCLSAILWARIKVLYYGTTRYDAEKAGFDDRIIYQVVNIRDDSTLIEKKQIEYHACLALFEEWEKKEDKQIY